MSPLSADQTLAGHPRSSDNSGLLGPEIEIDARDWAIAKGFRWLTLSVFEENSRAAEIYEKAGFKRDVRRLVQPLG